VRADALLAAVFRALRVARIDWDVLDLDHLLAESPLADAADGFLVRALREKQTTCDEIDATLPWDTLAAGFSSNFRSNLNKARNKLAKEKDVAYGVAETPAELAALLPPYMTLEASGWKGKEGTSIGQEPHAAEFYAKVLARFGAEGRARINWLKLGERYLAMQVCLVDGGTIYVVKLAYDEAYARYGPGNLLIEHVVRSGRYAKLNLVGSPVWFQMWRPAQQDVVRVRVFNTTARGALALGVLRAVEAARPVLAKVRAARASAST
jgi:CelD/BcsL family acetyltransferase involved in cellulose biosynthesis